MVVCHAEYLVSVGLLVVSEIYIRYYLQELNDLRHEDETSLVLL